MIVRVISGCELGERKESPSVLLSSTHNFVYSRFPHPVGSCQFAFSSHSVIGSGRIYSSPMRAAFVADIVASRHNLGLLRKIEVPELRSCNMPGIKVLEIQLSWGQVST